MHGVNCMCWLATLASYMHAHTLQGQSSYMSFQDDPPDKSQGVEATALPTYACGAKSRAISSFW